MHLNPFWHRKWDIKHTKALLNIHIPFHLKQKKLEFSMVQHYTLCSRNCNMKTKHLHQVSMVVVIFSPLHKKRLYVAIILIGHVSYV